mgnify:CR=1 FL=1
MMEVALVENMQRSDLDPIEEARGIKNMMDALKVTQEEAAKTPWYEPGCFGKQSAAFKAS